MEHKVFDFRVAEFVGDFDHGSPDWHEARKGAVGGSQVGTILGLNPWESAITCFHKMRGEIPSDIAPSMSMKIGTVLETPILQLFEAEHPELQVFTTGTYRRKGLPRHQANVDGLFVDADGVGIVEVKFSSDYWSEPPASYVAQVRWYMYVLGLDRAVIVALAGSSYREFWIDRDPFVESVMFSRVEEFLRCVDNDLRPDWDGSESTYQTMRQLNQDVVARDVELGAMGSALVAAQEAFSTCENLLNEMKSKVLDLMQDAKNGLVDGERICYRQNTKAGSPFLKIMKGK